MQITCWSLKQEIKNFDYDDLPSVSEKSFDELSNIIKSAKSPSDVNQSILGDCENDYAQKLIQLGDCNLTLETPLYLALDRKSLTQSVLLIVRESAELYFSSLSNQSAHQLIYDVGLIDQTFQVQIQSLISLLRKFSLVE